MDYFYKTSIPQPKATIFVNFGYAASRDSFRYVLAGADLKSTALLIHKWWIFPYTA